MKTRKTLKRISVLALFVVVVSLIGVRHEKRNPNQHINQYWAVRSLSVWTFFGTEVYASNELAVYDMTGRTTKDLPEPIGEIDIQTRRFGEVVGGNSQFNLGEENYNRDACIDFIYWVLGSSADPFHRMEATSVFRRELTDYPLTSQLRDTLASDPDEAVRGRMQTILAHAH